MTFMPWITCEDSPGLAPSPSVFAYCKQSQTGGIEGLGTRLVVVCVYPFTGIYVDKRSS